MVYTAFMILKNTFDTDTSTLQNSIKKTPKFSLGKGNDLLLYIHMQLMVLNLNSCLNYVKLQSLYAVWKHESVCLVFFQICKSFLQSRDDIQSPLPLRIGQCNNCNNNSWGVLLLSLESKSPHLLQALLTGLWVAFLRVPAALTTFLPQEGGHAD